MRFYDPERENSDSFSRTFIEEFAISFSAIDCLLNDEKAVYASSELTSGRRLQSLLVETGATRASELRAKIGEADYQLKVWDPNVAAATAFARRLHHTLEGNEIVITPAPFTAPGWNQRQYLSFWEELLRTRIKSAYFNDGWQYSNGCTFEFAVALDHGMPMFDHEGHPLSATDGLRLIQAAIDDCSRVTEPNELIANVELVQAFLNRHDESVVSRSLRR
jgi:hypothetical protein